MVEEVVHQLQEVEVVHQLQVVVEEDPVDPPAVVEAVHQPQEVVEEAHQGPLEVHHREVELVSRRPTMAEVRHHQPEGVVCRRVHRLGEEEEEVYPFPSMVVEGVGRFLHRLVVAHRRR